MFVKGQEVIIRTESRSMYKYLDDIKLGNYTGVVLHPERMFTRIRLNSGSSIGVFTSDLTSLSNQLVFDFKE